VLDWARVRGYRAGDNPARWKGHLANLLPERNAAKAARRREKGRAEHLLALPYLAVPDFLRRLRDLEGVAERALEFAILTACRTGEVLGAKWSEVDFAGRLWVIPSGRMKASREHRVPLSDEAIATLARLPDRDGFVFPAADPGSRLPRHALYALLKRLGCTCTVHGFRSSFADWTTERTPFSREERELSLAHATGNAIEAAYRRGDLLEKRRALMQAWARYCFGLDGAEVVPLRREP
jgi:integrase